MNKLLFVFAVVVSMTQFSFANPDDLGLDGNQSRSTCVRTKVDLTSSLIVFSNSKSNLGEEFTMKKVNSREDLRNSGEFSDGEDDQTFCPSKPLKTSWFADVVAPKVANIIQTAVKAVAKLVSSFFGW